MGDSAVRVTVQDKEMSADCVDGVWQATVDLTDAPDGDIAISATQTDVVGNTTTARATATKDTRIPEQDLSEVPSEGVDPSISEGTLSVTAGECRDINTSQTELLPADSINAPANTDILGGISFELRCRQAGGSAEVHLALSRYYSDPSVLRAYTTARGTLQRAGIRFMNEGGVTYAVFSLADGDTTSSGNLSTRMEKLIQQSRTHSMSVSSTSRIMVAAPVIQAVLMTAQTCPTPVCQCGQS